jgi:hypothetical protein
MRQRHGATIHELRLAIECLPRATRLAMLQGIQTNEIIAGAYSDANGICPMLAAHRAGGRTCSISFARAWDRFAFRDSRISRARPATERELLVLKTQLKASLLDDEGPTPDLAAVLADHRRLVARRVSPGPRHREAPAEDSDRIRELGSRHGWAWTCVVRRYDDYRRVLARLTSSPEADPDDGDRALVG